MHHLKPRSNTLNIFLNNTEHMCRHVASCSVMFGFAVVKRTQHLLNIVTVVKRSSLYIAHERTEQIFREWSNELNNTQHLFSEKFDRNETSLNKTQHDSTRRSNTLNILHSTKVQCCSVKCSVRLTRAFCVNFKAMRYESTSSI